MEFAFNIGNKTHRVSIEMKDGLYQIELGNKQYHVDCCSISPNCYSMLIGDKVHTVFIADSLEAKYVTIKGRQYKLDKFVQQEQVKSFSSPGIILNDGLISTPMPGKIVQVLVTEGEEVEKDQSLLIIESMKMENDISSPFKAKVIKVKVSAGDLAQPGESLIDIEKI